MSEIAFFLLRGVRGLLKSHTIAYKVINFIMENWKEDEKELWKKLNEYTQTLLDKE